MFVLTPTVAADRVQPHLWSRPSLFDGNIGWYWRIRRDHGMCEETPIL